MPLYSLVLIPFAAAAVAYIIPRSRWGRYWRPYLLPVTGITHLLLSIKLVRAVAGVHFEGWLALDPLSNLLLPAISVLFTICSLYAPAYLHLRPDDRNRVFCTCLLVLLGVMSLVLLSHHLGLMWVAVEATSITTAPLIYFNRSPLSIEAAWKYLLVCSVGIALALLGSFFLAYSSLVVVQGTFHSTLLFDDLFYVAPELSKPWLRVAFATLLVGYGTKMGLAPLHSWKPDAYGEAPGIVGALLAGGVTSCAFVAIVRFTSIMHAADEFRFASGLLIGLGVFSVIIAAVFLVKQRDIKRLLAYSSVEHMGILALGLGVGGLGCFAALFHLINNALAKGVLFISAGNIHRAFNSKSVDVVHGALRRTPWSAGFLLLGLFAITGSPPFSPFVSIFILVESMYATGRILLPAVLILALLVAFLGMALSFLAVLQGDPPADSWQTRYRDGYGTILPLMLLASIVLFLGVYLPPDLAAMLRAAVKYVEARV
jgi:hydrogenase-4 component F